MKGYLAFVLFLFVLKLYPQINGVGFASCANGFDRPLFVSQDDVFVHRENRLYAVEQGGKIEVLSNVVTVPIPFLDISSQISNGNEQDFLRCAFHPEYKNIGFFYINYTKPKDNAQVFRFSRDPTNSKLGVPNSQLPIIGYAQPNTVLTSNLDSGVYLVKITSEKENSITKKLII